MGEENENKASNAETSKKPLLKGKSKVLKKSINNTLKKKKASILQIGEKKKPVKGKNVVKRKEDRNIEGGDANSSKSNEESQQKNVVAEEQNKKEQQKLNQEIIGGHEKNQVERTSNEKLEGSKTSPKIEKDKENPSDLEKIQHNEKMGNKKKQKLGGSNKSLKIGKDKESTNTLEKSQQNEKRENKKKENLGGSNESLKIGKDKKNPHDLENSQQNEESDNKKKENLDGSNKGLKTGKDKKNPHELENSQQNEEKKNKGQEKLGGLIFMCSAKTKPDCFHYRVMGVSTSKKDLLLSLKPELKLFLYDFDLKLMYGIYKATSYGGMNLEPKAFGGAFPVQVRFSIYRDCYPLSESIFKKEMKETFTSRNKFRTELTVEQARKLSDLFQSAKVHPSRSVAASRGKVVHEERDSRPPTHRDTYARDPYSGADARSYPVESRERGGNDVHNEVTPDLYLTEKDYRAYGLQRKRKHSSHRSVSPSVNHYHHDRYHLLSQHSIAPGVDRYQRDHDRDYLLTQHTIAANADPYQRNHDRDYLLTRHTIAANADPYQRDCNRNHLLTQHPTARNVDLYQRDRDRDLLRHPDLVYRSTEPAEKEYGGPNHLYMTESEYPASAFGGSLATTVVASTSATDHRDDPYYTRLYGTSLMDQYTRPTRREEAQYSLSGRSYPLQTHHVQRRGSAEGAQLKTDQMERLNYTFARDIDRSQGTRPEPAGMPISSTYTFDSLSLPHR